MPIQPSFTKYYWLAWLVACALWLASSQYWPLADSFGSFALLSGLGAVYVFHFELGRLVGFLRAHAPADYAELQDSPLLQTLAFIHPRIHQKLWAPANVPARPGDTAFRVYRSAWVFSALTIAALLVLANVWQ